MRCRIADRAASIPFPVSSSSHSSVLTTRTLVLHKMLHVRVHPRRERHQSYVFAESVAPGLRRGPSWTRRAAWAPRLGDGSVLLARRARQPEKQDVVHFGGRPWRERERTRSWKCPRHRRHRTVGRRRRPR
ncbi:hypothetical protein SETIT_5G423300v2 [Setaria italica]|uniref:Uncharacterized protein n=1 Tax=Setaria italica TaxID=4555 RepID=A0A368RF57_SETIT|nr:hypothetical protein SETIT_5G423300v2 [Setaria italica]